MIFSVFIVAAIIFSVFVFVYRGLIDRALERSLASLTVCGNITSEGECFAKESCEGIYAPSCPTCTDVQFQRCQRIPLQEVGRRQTEQMVCEQTGGQWYRNPHGQFCLCDRAGIDMVFNHEAGCQARPR